MKTLTLIAYSWITAIGFGVFIVWMATVPNFEAGTETYDEVIKLLLRITVYSIFFLLTYRALIVTLKSTINRLANWRSKREKIEDAEFVLVVETLVVIITVLATILFSVFEEYIQNFIDGRTSELKDVLVSTMAALLTGIVVYSMPVLGEFEIMLKKKFENLFRIRK